MQMKTTMMKLSKNKILLGLSGGVDSTAACLLLKEKGLEVTGLFFDVTGKNEEGRKAASDLAERMGIDFIYKDISQAFEKIVISNFCSEYSQGRTPNPCVLCNPNVKFKVLTDAADEIGAYYIATGHYARIFHNQAVDKYFVIRGTNEKKDQSYMLYRLSQDVLKRIIFPLGEIQNKEETRNITRNMNMPNSETEDSMEICFIDSSESYVEYIKRKGFSSKDGNFIDSQGNILGRHKGILNYTVGQRKGLGIALGKPAFVTKITPEDNTVTLGDNSDLFGKTVISNDNFFSAGEPAKLNEGVRVMAKIRYAAKPSPAVIYKKENGLIETKFDESQRAATPGQSIVFYQNDVVIGGGFIE